MTAPQAAPASRPLAAIGVIVALTLAFLQLGSWLSPGTNLAARIGREAVWWAIGALVIVWVLRVERLPLASIGLRALRWKGIAWGLLATVAMMASVMFSYAVIFPAFGLKMNMDSIRGITQVPMWLQTATMARAGVVEEIVFRGYAIERIALLTGSRWAGAVLSAAAFIAVHISGWGYAQLIVVAFGAAILTALYMYRRDLGSNMLAHFLTDFIGFLLARLQS